MTTTNLSDFGYKELNELQKILKAMMENGLPEDFYDDEVVPMMNKNSGCVFLTNSNYEVAMLRSDGSLESWYTLPYTGNEGFLDELTIDLLNGNIEEDDDVEYIVKLLDNNNDENLKKVLDYIKEDYTEIYENYEYLIDE